MQPEPLHVLLVEDNPGDARLVRELLRAVPGANIHEVDRLSAGIEHLAGHKVDVVLLDLGLPDGHGLDTLRTLIKAGCTVPVVVLTGQDEGSVGRAAMREGAQDYLVKGRVAEDALTRAIHYAIERNETRAKLRHVNRALRAIRNVNQLIAREKSPARLVQQACDVLVGSGSYENAFIVLANEAPHPFIVGGAMADGADSGPATDAIRSSGLTACLKDAWGSTSPIIKERGAPACRDCPLRAGHSGRWRLAGSLEHGGSPFGVMVVALADGARPDEEEVDLFTGVAGDIAYGLRSIETEEKRRRAEAEARESEARYRDLYDNAPTAYFNVGVPDGTIRDCNLAAGRLVGLDVSEMRGKNVRDLHAGLPFADGKRARVAEGWHAGEEMSDAELRMKRADGSAIDVSLSVQSSRDRTGAIVESRTIVVDITERKRTEELLAARLQLQEFAATHTLEELLQKTLDEAERLTGSEVGFYHFLEADQRTLSLQAWSSRTLKEFCTAAGKGRHYSVAEAGVWVDCVHQRRPVVHNDYAALPHKKGLPDGHAPVIREFAVPIFRKDAIVAILGVGNKPTDYTAEDVNTVAYLADGAWEITERKRAEDSVRQSEERYRAIVDNAMDGIIVLDAAGKVLEVNDAFARAHGYTADELIELGLAGIDVDSAAQTPERIRRLLAGETLTFEVEHERKDGSRFPLEVTAGFVEFGGTKAVIGFHRDITERKRAEEERVKLEAQFHQAQKMESVGVLAGGVAHDFNNLLSVVLGYTDLLLEDLRPGDPTRADVEEIKRAGERARDLTGQLLAFSRKQMLEPKPSDLNQIIAGMAQMLRRLLGEDIDLSLPVAHELGTVYADPGQLEQVVMNLAVNARDAAPRGGSVSIETKNVELDAAYAAEHLGVAPGPYVMMAVTDTGSGMDKATQARIFEPFFTTKEMGKGTGLGLSTVFGIVHQSGGHLDVHSEPGVGTVFRVYLPRADGPAPVVSKTAFPPADLRGSETILLVEDDEQVRAAARAILHRHGYKVLEAQNGGEAFLICDTFASEIHLLLTDVVMPRMSGREVVDRLTPMRPEMKVLYMSGYTEQSIVHRGIVVAGIAFLRKPFTAGALTRKVREVLSSSPTESVVPAR